MNVQTLKRFSRRPTQRLRPHKKPDYSKFGSLPFITGRAGQVNFWSVPATGEYFGGFATGEAIARQYMHFLQMEPGTGLHSGLASVVRGLFKQYESVGGDEMEKLPIAERTPEFNSVRGQMCGFFWELSSALSAHVGRHPRHHTMDELIEHANMGIGFDEARYTEYLTALDVVEGIED
jgi:hypothetical protein